MKKKILRLTTLLLCLLLLGASFCSCASLALRFSSEEKRPMKLYEAVMENMDSLRSATIKTSVTLTAIIADTRITATSSQTEQVSETKDELLHRNWIKTTSKIDSQTTTSVSLSGYQDGEMYFAHGTLESKFDTHLKANLTAEEYIEHQKTLAEHLGFDFDFAAICFPAAVLGAVADDRRQYDQGHRL